MQALTLRAAALTAVVSISLTLTSTAVAGPTPTPPAAAGPAAKSMVDDIDATPLSVDEAIALALQNNLGVEVERYAPLIAEQDSRGAWGAYDPTLNGSVGYSEERKENTVRFLQTPLLKTDTVDGDIGLQTLLPWIGASVGITATTKKVKTNTPSQTYDPGYTSTLFLNAKLPMLRNLIWNQPWTNVKVTELAYKSSVDEFEKAVMDTLRSTVDRYWTLVANAEKLRVARKSLETTRALLDQVRTQYDVGVVSRVEVIEAEAGVADREFQLIVAENTYRNAQDALVDAVLGVELTPGSRIGFVPIDDPEEYEVETVSPEGAVQVAFERRPELRAAEQAIEQSEISLRFAKNQRLPQFDVEFTYGFIGVGGAGNPRISPTPADGNSWNETWDDFYTPDGADNYTVRGVFSIPIPNTTARRQVNRSRIELRRAETSKLRLQQQIILAVRAAARTLLASAQGIEAAERQRVAAEEQLRAERIRLEHGESTPFEVLQREEQLVQAESQKIAALQAYRAAEVGLEREQGTILDRYSVRIDDVRTPVMKQRNPGWELGLW